MNDDTMEQFALVTDKINIELDDVRKESRLKLNTQLFKMEDQVQ